MVLKERVDALDKELGRRFFARPEARVLSSFPRMGPILGADRLAAYAGLVPAARDSGKRVGNHRKGRGGNRVLKRVFYQKSLLQHAGRTRVEGLLRPQEARRQEARPGRDRPGEEEGERPLGDAARRGHLRGPIRGLTTS